MEAPAFPDVVQLAVPFFIGAMVLEVVVARLTGRARYETRDTIASLLMGAGNLVESIALGFVGYGLLSWLYEHAPVQLGFSPGVFLAAFILDELRFYWTHRLGHEVRWLWAAHVVHHSSQHYNLSTALRQPWANTVSGWFLFQAPLALLGFHPALLAVCGSISLVYQFWIHTEAIGRLPRALEWLFNTPSHHRVHHATNPRYLDANYGGVFIVWDRLFGSFVPEDDDERPRYGIVKNLGTFNPLRICVHEWVGIFADVTARGLSWRERLGYAFGPPGYSHDGSRKTSAMLKRDYVARHPEHAGKPGLPSSSQPASSQPSSSQPSSSQPSS